MIFETLFVAILLINESFLFIYDDKLKSALLQS